MKLRLPSPRRTTEIPIPAYTVAFERHSSAVQALSARQAAAAVPAALRAALRLALRTNRRTTALTALAQLATAAAYATILIATSHVLTRLASEGMHTRVLTASAGALAALAAALAVRSLAGAAQAAASARLGARADTLLEHDLLAAATRAPLPAYDDPAWRDAKEAAERAAKEAHVLLDAAIAVGTSVISIGMSAAVLAGLHPLLLAVLPAAVLPKAWAALAAARARYRAAAAVLADRRARHSMMYAISGADSAAEVRAGVLADWLLGKFADLSTRLEAAADTAATRAAVLTIAGDAASGAGLLAVYAMLAALTWTHQIPAAAAGTAIVGIRMVCQILAGAARDAARLYEAGLYHADYQEFLNGIGIAPATATAPQLPAAVEIHAEAVSFTYPGQTRPAINDVTFTCRPGVITALVGANGAGKSTLARLAAGLYPPSTGMVTWAGVDLADPDAGHGWAWHHLAYIPQSFTRWPFTVAENIALATGADQNAIRAAAAAADAGFIDTLPEGLATSLAPGWWGGRSVSGGQWQRLALARAYLAADAPVLIADEPTAALDPLAELAALGHLVDLAAGRTVLLVTHRLGICPRVDWIYVLDEGRVVEQGQHAALLAAGGMYSAMFTAQADAYADVV